MMHDKNKTGWAFMGGLVFGYILSLFMGESSRTKQRQLITSTAADLKKLLTDPHERERVKEVFGVTTKKAMKTYQGIREDLVSRLSEIKGGIALIDKNKYSETVSSIIEDLRREQMIDTTKLTKLREFLMDDYQLLKTTINSPEPNVDNEIV